MFSALWFKKCDDSQKRNEIYNNVFKGKFDTSVDLEKIIACSIYKKTKWYKHIGKGWYNFIAKINNNCYFDFWITDLKNILPYMKNTLPVPILFSMLIINVKDRRILEKFKIKFKQILNGQTFFSDKNKKIKPKVEVVDNWIFIVFPKLLNLDSIKTLNTIIYELNKKEFKR